MAEKAKDQSCCTPDNLIGCCNIEALVSVDERGQMILPKEIRDRAGIRPGDKLALIIGERDGKVSGMFLMKADELSGMVKGMLGPLFREILK
jgi:antitoxin PrlF